MGHCDLVEVDGNRVDAELFVDDLIRGVFVCPCDLDKTPVLDSIQSMNKILLQSKLVGVVIRHDELSSTGVGHDRPHARQVDSPHSQQVGTPRRF